MKGPTTKDARTLLLCFIVFVLSLCSAQALKAQGKQKQNRAGMRAKAKMAPLAPSSVKADAPQNTSADDESVESADVAITANVRASSLKFDIVPNPTVEFPGKPQADTVWEAERDNLPRPVQPGVTYRDIGIRLKITSRFRDIDRIVSEALGEIPVSDGVPPTSEKPSTPPQPGSARPPRRERR